MTIPPLQIERLLTANRLESDAPAASIERRQSILDAALAEQEDLDKLFRANPSLRWEFYAEMPQMMLFAAATSHNSSVATSSSSSSGGSKRDAAPPSFQAYSHAMNADDEGVAAALLSILRPDNPGESSPTRAAEAEHETSESSTSAAAEREARGFVYFFATKTGASWGPTDGLGKVAVSLAHLLSLAAAPEVSAGVGSSTDELVKQRFRQLFVMLYHFHAAVMVPTHAQVFAHSFELLFRLLLQYHDPLIALHFDQRQVDVGCFAYRWIRDVFAAPPAAQAAAAPPIVPQQLAHDEDKKNIEEFATRVWPLWDLLLVHQEPLLPCLLAVVALVECREQILTSCTSTDECHQFLAKFHISHAYRRPSVSPSRRQTPPRSAIRTPTSSVVPSFSILPPCERAKDLVVKARLALRNTPLTAQASLKDLLYPDAEFLQREPREVRDLLLTYVAIPVDSLELVSAFASPTDPTMTTTATASAAPKRPTHGHSIGYVILDCRSSESFQFARLPTALHVGDAIGFDAELLQKMRDRFAAARGSHLCILGTGRALIEEVNLLKLIVLHLVQHGFPYVSVATGGFRALIPFIKSGKVEFVRGGAPKVKKAAASPPRASTGCIPLAPADDHDTADPPRQPQRASSTSPTTTAPSGSTVDDIKAKASSWGWGFVKAVTEKVDDLRRPKSAASTDEVAEAASKPTPPLPSANATNPTGGLTTTSPPTTSVVDHAKKPLFSTTHKPASKQSAQPPLSTTTPIHIDAHQQMMKSSQETLDAPELGGQQATLRGSKRSQELLDDDDDEELDLITTIAPPTHAAAKTPARSPTAAVVASSSTSPSKPAALQQPTAASDVDDLDELYSSPPARQSTLHPAAPQINASSSSKPGAASTAPASASPGMSDVHRARSTQKAIDDFDDIFN